MNLDFINKNKTMPVALIILDGWGYAPSWGGNAIAEASTPNFDRLWREYPHTTLHASGEWVGLTGHERGNSEVGHLNLGTGKVMMQDMTRINQNINNHKLDTNEVLIKLLNHVKKYNSNIHLMGLVSDGAIHSHIDHLFALLDYFAKHQDLAKRIFIHVFTDGRDSAPQDALTFISQLIEKSKQTGVGQIATISGRYYAMDRDNHWERIAPVYKIITEIHPSSTESALSAIGQAYNKGQTDEFITPIAIHNGEKTNITANDNDAFLFFNFRADRAREITRAFTQINLTEFKREKILKNIFFCTMVPFGVEEEFITCPIYALFKPADIQSCLAEILAKNNKTQLHIAETEKYAHVTYFFNGGQEKPFSGEDRILIPSPRIASYDMLPEMSASQIAKKTLDGISRKKYDFMVVNFANPDMVGHTGNYKAAIRACEAVDNEFNKIIEAIQKQNGVCIVTADHGNAEQMANPKTGEPDTEHTTNSVPCIIVHPKKNELGQLKNNMKLANVASTILDFMKIQKPDTMDEKLF